LTNRRLAELFRTIVPFRPLVYKTVNTTVYNNDTRGGGGVGGGTDRADA